MATLSGTLKGANATNRDAVPSIRAKVQQEHGRVRYAYDSYTVPSADELGTSAVVNFMKIPKGARLIEAELNVPASGATGQFTVGWLAGANGDEAADADGIFTTQDPGLAAIDRGKMLNSVAGYNKEFSEEVQVQLAVSEITADAGGDKWELAIMYVLD